MNLLVRLVYFMVEVFVGFVGLVVSWGCDGGFGVVWCEGVIFMNVIFFGVSGMVG